MNELLTTEEGCIAEYRQQHPKCVYCAHCIRIISRYEDDKYRCEVKRKEVFPNIPRYFCPLFKVDTKR